MSNKSCHFEVSDVEGPRELGEASWLFRFRIYLAGFAGTLDAAFFAGASADLVAISAFGTLLGLGAALEGSETSVILGRAIVVGRGPSLGGSLGAVLTFQPGLTLGAPDWDRVAVTLTISWSKNISKEILGIWKTF